MRSPKISHLAAAPANCSKIAAQDMTTTRVRACVPTGGTPPLGRGRAEECIVYVASVHCQLLFWVALRSAASSQEGHRNSAITTREPRFPHPTEAHTWVGSHGCGPGVVIDLGRAGCSRREAQRHKNNYCLWCTCIYIICYGAYRSSANTARPSSSPPICTGCFG